MNTEEIMELSLKLAGLSAIPEDSEIYVSGKNIRKVLFGIDAGPSELLLAKSLGLDAVIAHHPMSGKAMLNLHQVFKRHIQQMTAAGISKAEAEKTVQKKLQQLEIEAHSRNYDHAADFARIMKMPYMNIHTPLDEVGRRIMSQQISKHVRQNSTVQEVVSALEKLPEFQNSQTKIKIRLGKPDNVAGKVAVSHGAGTNGGYEIAKAYFEHGTGTLIYIHVAIGDLEKLRADNVGNLVVTGHIASDSLGINPFIRELEKRGIEATTIGLIRA